MDIKRFFKLFKKYVWILVLLPVLAATVTYFLSKNLAKEYQSTVQIATGLVDKSKQITPEAQGDFFNTNQQFNNIIEQMKMRKIMSILSYNLILHDLENPKSRFRKYSPKIDSLSNSQRQEVINIYRQRLSDGLPITIYDNDGKYKLYDLIGSMGYDELTLSKKLTITRPDNSDFINISIVSESPLLSAYTVNTLASEFIRKYSTDESRNRNNSTAMLDSVLNAKAAAMNSKNAALKDFKMKTGVLNLDAQSSGVYAQISQYEERKAQAIRDIQANQGALSAINSKLNNVGTYIGGSVISDNNALLSLRNQLKVANDRYIDGNFKPSDKKKMDSLQNLISTQSLKSSDNNVVDPIVSKQGLVQRKTELEISTEQIKNTIGSIDRELASLKAQFNTMVPYDAGIQNYVRDADIATKDYMAALDRTNMNQSKQITNSKLQIAQIGLPGMAQPSKSIIFVALAGIATFMICFASLVVLFLLDRSIYTPRQLTKETGAPVVGALNLMSQANIEPRTIWNDQDSIHDYSIYKDMLRSLRFEINKQFDGSQNRILGITSLAHGEGKSYLASSLIYAFAMTGKKVLLISGEDETNNKSTSQKLLPSEFFETFIVKKEFHTEDLITVFNNKLHNTSLLETQSMQNLKDGFEILRKEFDLIIIDINSLKELNRAKEWLMFTDKSLAVFEYGAVITDEDKDKISYVLDQPGFMGWVLNKVKSN
jgi:succinoglycan biosynthesis transport protein ExoP